jgi:hypothetical protein
MPPIELKDYIFELKFEEGFKQYMNSNFDLKDLEKYVLDQKLGLFHFDCIIKIFMASFVWKNIIFDAAQAPYLKERLNFLRLGDQKAYKDVIHQLEELEEKVFQSCFIRVKETIKILEENFQRSMSLHMVV